MLHWGQGRAVSSRKTELVNHSALLLLWCVNLEALHHQKRLLSHFLPREMLQRSYVVQESVLWCLLPAGGQLDWVCWQSGKIPAGHLPGAVPAWETLSVLPAWLPTLLPPAPACVTPDCHPPAPGSVTPDSHPPAPGRHCHTWLPACGSWGTSAAVVTKSSWLGTRQVYGLGIPITEVGRWRRFVRAEIARAYFVRVRFWNNSCLLSSLLYNCFLTLASREIQTEPEPQWCYQQTF